jgi:hypothetical protein
MVKAIGEVGKGYIPPTRKKLSTEMIEKVCIGIVGIHCIGFLGQINYIW